MERGGKSFGEQRLENEQMCRFKLNSSLSSFEAIKGEQLGPIDGVPLKEIRSFDKKSDISPGNCFRVISLITADEKNNNVIANGPTWTTS